MKILDGLFGRLWTARRWVAGQFGGTLLLMLAALAWTRLPDKHGWQVALSLLIPLLLDRSRRLSWKPGPCASLRTTTASG